ncbi:MAG: hypothetical protein ABSC42_07840 [Tepidisphaeraceae bacterium]|jgi:hypothetical protein
MNAKHLVLGVLISMSIIAGRAIAQTSQKATTATTVPAATRPGVTLINLHLKQAVAQDVFDELARQADVKFTTNGNIWDQDSLQIPKDVDFTDRTFWSAVWEACGLWNLSIQQNYSNDLTRRIMLFSTGQMPGGDMPKLPVYETDGFVIQALSFSRQQNVNYAHPGGASNFCNVQLRVYIDPALRVQSFNSAARTDQAVDDAGNSMKADVKSRMSFVGSSPPRSLLFDCNVPLKYPDNPGKKIAHLKGSLQLRVADKMDSLTVDKPLAAAEISKSIGNRTVTFHSLKKMAEPNYQLSVSFDVNTIGSDTVWQLLQNNAQLLDDKGRQFQEVGGSGTWNKYTVNYVRHAGEDSPIGDPVKWVIELPSKAHTMRVPFEFKDLPLP